MVEGIRKIGYPYVFVAGNHDSRTVIGALERLSNVTVLNGKVATVQGFTLLGLPNPASARAAVGSVDTTPAELQAGSDTLMRTLQSLQEPPDILAIHNPEEARPLWGSVPIVLCGHMHRFYVETEKGSPPPPSSSSTPSQISAAPTDRKVSAPPAAAIGPRFETIVCNAGTTGAAGLRYFEREQGIPFSCAVLTFRRSAPRPAASTPAGTHPGAQSPTVPAARPRLASIDLIVLDGALHQYSITHRPFAESPIAPAIPAIRR